MKATNYLLVIRSTDYGLIPVLLEISTACDMVGHLSLRNVLSLWPILHSQTSLSLPSTCFSSHNLTHEHTFNYSKIHTSSDYWTCPHGYSHAPKT